MTEEAEFEGAGIIDLVARGGEICLRNRSSATNRSTWREHGYEFRSGER